MRTSSSSSTLSCDASRCFSILKISDCALSAFAAAASRSLSADRSAAACACNFSSSSACCFSSAACSAACAANSAAVGPAGVITIGGVTGGVTVSGGFATAPFAGVAPAGFFTPGLVVPPMADTAPSFVSALPKLFRTFGLRFGSVLDVAGTRDAEAEPV